MRTNGNDSHRKINDMLIPNINEQYHLYPILLIASLIIGLLIPSIKLAKAGIRKDVLLCVALLNMFLALFCGKMYTMIADKSTDIFRTGFSSLGGLIGFLIGTYIFYLICDKDKRILKNYIISLPLIYAVSKVGCFLAGCCHGIEYAGIFSVKYEVDSACALVTAVFPVQITETIVFLGIYILLNMKKKKENIVTYTLLLCTVAKFILDFLRYSHIGKLLSFNQIICLVIAFICIICDLVNSRRRMV